MPNHEKLMAALADLEAARSEYLGEIETNKTKEFPSPWDVEEKLEVYSQQFAKAVHAAQAFNAQAGLSS